MCGISGIAFSDPDRVAEQSALCRMTAIQRHRGPDGEGFYVAAGIGLGVCRLSIVDPLTGDQPITNEGETVALICNGEIYNYPELRERLARAGHRFRTGSDAEVVVHLYEERGKECLGELRGMFALALWDTRNRELLLARDRLGIKPLHYALTASGLVFSSEIKGILASGLVPAKIDRAILFRLFASGYLPPSRTLVAGVRQLPAGHWLKFRSGRVFARPYWDVSFPAADRYDRRMTGADWAEALRAKLTESVKLHLRSDVPVGSWLSGGIDSSAVTALMARESQDHVHTFTLGFEERSVDESRTRAMLDQFPGFSLAAHRAACGRGHLALLPRAVWHREQPFGLGVEISRMVLAELTARDLKVVLTGEGADEVLGGYSWYRADKLLRYLRRLPRGFRKAAADLVELLAPETGWHRLVAAPPEITGERFSALTGAAVWPDGCNTCLSEDMRQEAAEAMEEDEEEFSVPTAFDQWHPFAQLQYFDLKVRLAALVCHHLDRMSMARSVEARVPYLDHVLVEFCATIPPWVKLRRFREKDVLRRAMRGVLPSEILRRKKFPLSAPVGDWMGGKLPEFACELLSPDMLRAKGYFDPAKVARLRAAGGRSWPGRSRQLLLVLTTQLWDELFLKRLEPPSARVEAPSDNRPCATG